MPELLPFRALRYDPRAVPDASAVLCPPYDVISAERRERLAARDERNAVHVELPVSHDSGPDAAYRHASELFASWQASGVLRRDERPMIYAYEQQYAAAGTHRAARGFFCRLRLEEYAAGEVLPHERTLSAAKDDRLRLMTAVRANLSPILLLYRTEDAGRESGDILARLMAGPPDLSATTDDGAVHRLWAIDPTTMADGRRLLELASAGPLTIADGHHRYETALRYRDELAAVGGRDASSADHVLALMYDSSSGGLSVLPWHRVVRGAPEAETVLAALSELFDVVPQVDSATLIEALDAGESGRLGAWMRDAGALLMVDRARLAALVQVVDSGSETLRWLDVTVLSSTLPRMIGSSADVLAANGRLTYTSDAAEAVADVDDGAADVCFLLRATPIESVLAVAAEGGYMPAKSTYFQPKAATGLVFNLLSG